MMNSDGTFKQDIQCIVAQTNGCGAIFVSNLEAACNPLTLKKHNIGAVITAIKGKNLAQQIPKHIEYFYIPVVDHESCNISVFFKDSFEFIEEERKRTNVLVHCMAGVSRSVTLVIAYIMQKSGAPFQTAYNYVKSKRSIIHPNEAFVQQLQELEKRLKGGNDSVKNYKIEGKMISKFGQISKQSQVVSGKISNLTSFQDTHESWSKKSNFSSIHHPKIESKWFTNTKSPHKNEQKQNQGQIPNTYDATLRANIKKLFSQGNSRVNLLRKSELMR